MADNSRGRKHDNLGTYVVRFMQHQNGTWQGRLTWIDEDKSMNFRSMWELVRLMEEGLITSNEFEEEDLPSWE